MTFDGMRHTKLAAVTLALFAAGCGAAEEDGDLETDDLDLFAASGKTDTGYVSDQAAELNATLTGTVVLDVTARADKTALLAAATAQNKAAFATFPGEQVKYGRNKLKNQKFNANLESETPAIGTITKAGNLITIPYVIKVESLVKLKDLPAGTTIASMIGQTVTMKLPADPTTALAKGGIKCATDPDEPTAPDAATAAELADHNYFFYWNAEKPGCALATKDVVFKVTNEAAAKTTYPEFDKLLADKKITGVAIFGQLEHGDLLAGPAEDNWDWGFIGYEEFTDFLTEQGYKEISRTPARAPLATTKKSKWSKKYSTNMTVEWDVISPVDLQDHADATIKDGIIKDAMKNHELVYYNGHSFYGSLKVLDDKANFPTYYQIVFMDSCWSYAYYTKQVFTNKATSADPTGMLISDVINNTEPGISGSHVTYTIFLKKLFYAANYVAKGQKASAKSYNWKNLITYMNTSAKKRAEDSAKEGDVHDPEIYGASGVTTNKWKP